MKIEITDEQVARIVMRANTRDSGYNGAWLDGHKALAVELGIVGYNPNTLRYEEVER